ncbi:hypothetical protein FACS1894180_7610 [Bacteroidia bacterium]|nr:hypothetical protein FACS1894180_7610 [Bacteroidia bacterium]
MELLTVNWGNTLIVVCFGFGIVFVILVLLVLLLNLWQSLMGKPKTETLTAQGALQTKQPKGRNANVDCGNNNLDHLAIATALAAYSNNLDNVAIAAALYLYFDEAHDVENAVLTIKPRTSAWNAKIQFMNNLTRKN